MMTGYSIITAKTLAALESFLTHRSRRLLLAITETVIVVGIFFLIYAHYLSSVPFLAVRTLGVLTLFLVFWIALMLLDSYARSYDSDHEPFWLHAYMINSRGKSGHDYVVSYVESRPGYEVMLRLGMDVVSIDRLIQQRKAKTGLSAFAPSADALISFRVFSEEIFKGEKDLQDALFKIAVQGKEFLGAVDLVIDQEDARRQAERWWTPVNLSHIKCIGKDWSYGDTFRLDRYGEDLTKRRWGAINDVKNAMHAAEIGRIEAALSRADEMNVILVGHPGAGVNDIVNGLADKIMTGKTTAELAHKRVVLFRGVSLVSGSKEKELFEKEFLLTMKEAIYAGNIVLIFDDFAAFCASALALGSDVTALLNPCLSSSAIQIIALTDATRYHAMFEGNQTLMSKFEKVIIEELDHNAVVGLISHMSSDLEARTGLTFTYPALLAIVDCAEQYFTEGVMPDKAVDLLVDLSSTLVRDHDFFVSKDDVLQFVKIKTKIPVGAIDVQEREKLANLETYLHERVVGQDEAVKAVATALRRVRSGIRNPKRPIGTFLFLGPTGVGKTETAKALAGAYFGDEASMMRLDMNQYKETDSIDRLIGSFGTGKPGTLSSIIRDKKYGVLLLDEFEKASNNVKDLFLQVLDEGIFTDATGEKVNARNIIFIATSNAGSDEIFKIVNGGGKLNEHKDELINQLVAGAVLKPELMNRFDGVVLFEPLSKENLTKIAVLILNKLQSRLREKGIDFVVNQSTIDAVVAVGYDPKFGARPMNRAVQDRVEGLIARKIISGELVPGSRIELTAADLA